MFSLPQLVGIPYDASSSFLRGAAAAPPLIRAAMTSPAGNSFTESGADLTGLADAGDLALGEDAAAARAAIQAGIAAMLENGFRPISLGGDHSITYPIMRAIAKRHRGVTILHIDAHADLYDEYEGDRYSHACPFARIMEEDLCATAGASRHPHADPAPARTDRAIRRRHHRDAAFRRRRAAGHRRARCICRSTSTGSIPHSRPACRIANLADSACATS